VEARLHSYSSLVLDGGERSFLPLCFFNSRRKVRRYTLDVPRVRLDTEVARKRSPSCLGNRTLVVQPVVVLTCYPDCMCMRPGSICETSTLSRFWLVVCSSWGRPRQAMLLISRWKSVCLPIAAVARRQCLLSAANTQEIRCAGESLIDLTTHIKSLALRVEISNLLRALWLQRTKPVQKF
jgi:hypothetical protein